MHTEGAAPGAVRGGPRGGLTLAGSAAIISPHSILPPVWPVVSLWVRS
jgi:hypothetical protein